MSPSGGIIHSVSDRRSSLVVSMSDVHYALSEPVARRLQFHLELGERGALHLYGGVVPVHVDVLAPCAAAEPFAVEPDFEPAKEHASRRHLVDERVEPVREEDL